MDAARTSAHLRAYALWEQLQGDDHGHAAGQLPSLETDARAGGWDDVAFVAAAAAVAYAVVRPGAVAPDLAGLRARAEGLPASAEALALALTALHALGTGDAETVLTAAGRAVALLDEPDLPPLDRCTAYVVCGAAYNGLSLWELVDELYEQAQALAPRCPAPVQDAALAVNRVLVRTERATALLEDGDDVAAGVQLRRVLQAADESDAVAMPPLWRSDVEACRSVVGLLLGGGDDTLLDGARAQRDALAEADDLEAVALLDAARALALHAAGREEEAREVARLVVPRSASSGATSLSLWARAQVLDPAGWAGEAGEYARTVAAQRRQSRHAVLVAARGLIALERLAADHRRLSLDLATDVLTGLSSRRELERWLAAPPRRGGRAAVLLLDLDGFKQVNDVHGHDTGDDVLRALGHLVAEQVRPGDLAVRAGGDELVVVLDDVDGAAALLRGHALHAAVTGHDWERLAAGLQVAVSIGIAVGPLSDTPRELYRRADGALYAAKADGSGVVLADPCALP
ncbi:MAG: diguanylate cyclase [Frankiales bacterium]|nr:diguanylate cyclase [Frankiales bacterium]